ncbi:glucose-6-phosphate isomerase [Erysipelothrix piscisicarius]|uniref:Glucose-6-phosphate isomerase n=2 Tax=Erysipelothrix piscisicarius TaxID=2485784 RepID=A0A451ENU0_9FIRM|nr:glucose-6-phosphate isomerase [Erysipelothrix piscisicarius]
MKRMYMNGQIVEGTITGIQPYGAFVSIDENTTGLIHISEISDDFVRDIRQFVSQGERIIAKIIDVSEGPHQLRLSLKALNYSSRKDRQSKDHKRPLVPSDSIGFETLADMMPQWLSEKENPMIRVDLKHALLEEDVLSYQDDVSRIHEMIHSRSGKGNDYLGWLDWAERYDVEEFARIKECAKRIQDQADVLLVCGIGGSYLGSRAAIEMIQGPFPKNDLEIIYVGNTFSSTSVVRILDYIKDKEVACNVISKSGTTTETALAFRMIRQFMEEKYGADASKRIYATTDKERGLLKPQADAKGYESFVIPDDIGGRFSVITPVGLLPMAAAGLDIDKFMAGVKKATFELNNPDLSANPAYVYAVVRRMLEKQGKSVEMFVSYESHLVFLAEWWKQLFGESEGKDGKGLLPASVNFSTDLHSMGQFVQDGNKVLFETVVLVDKPIADMVVPTEKDDLDQMNYLAGKSLHWINEKAFEGTLEAHEVTGGVPNVLIHIDKANEENLGYAMYFFFKALAMSVYMLDVNPFDQPGVEVYKKNMFKLLGK